MNVLSHMVTRPVIHDSGSARLGKLRIKIIVASTLFVYQGIRAEIQSSYYVDYCFEI
jgi:hypothetical protein